MVRIMILNEIQLFNSLMAAALERTGSIQVVKTCTLHEAYLDALQSSQIDVVLISGMMPASLGIDLVRKVKEMDNYEVVVFGVEEKTEDILPYFEAGASGYVTRDATMQELVDVIHTANKGHVQISPPIAKALVERLSALVEDYGTLDKDIFNRVALTRREMQVLELLEKDLTNQEIADRLHLEVGTVKNHIHSILKKLNVSSRHEAVRYLGVLRNNQEATYLHDR